MRPQTEATSTLTPGTTVHPGAGSLKPGSLFDGDNNTEYRGWSRGLPRSLCKAQCGHMNYVTVSQRQACVLEMAQGPPVRRAQCSCPLPLQWGW